MSTPELERTLIGFRTAILLYALLLITSALTLKGTPLALALIIVLGLAAKSTVHHFRSKLEAKALESETKAPD